MDSAAVCGTIASLAYADLDGFCHLVAAAARESFLSIIIPRPFNLPFLRWLFPDTAYSFVNDTTGPSPLDSLIDASYLSPSSSLFQLGRETLKNENSEIGETSRRQGQCVYT